MVIPHAPRLPALGRCPTLIHARRGLAIAPHAPGAYANFSFAGDRLQGVLPCGLKNTMLRVV